MGTSKSLPKSLGPYFWDYQFSNLSLKTDRDLIIRRILINGSWKAILWLRRQIGDENLKSWLIAHRGRGLSPRQLRFWELIFDLPKRQVNAWVKEVKISPWEKR
jgi:hypothetical protein